METLQPKLRFPEFKGNWNKKILSDVNISVIDGDRGTNYPNGDDFTKVGYCLFLNAKNVTKNGFSFTEKSFINQEKDEKLRKGKLKRDDIILTTRGSVGHISYYDKGVPFDNIRINSGMVIIRADHKYIIPDYLYKYFNSNQIQNEIKVVAFGSAQPQLTVNEILKFKICYPSLQEQTRIANFLSSVDEKLNLLKEKKALLEDYKKGIMQKIFNQEIRFKDDDGNDFEEWEEKSLGEIADFYKGKGLPKNHISDDGEYKCIHYGELFTKYDELIKNIISKTNIYDKPFLSVSNDVLMPTSDVTPNGLATASCIKEDDVILGGDVLIIRQKTKILDGVFLAFYIKQFKDKVMKLVSGSTVYHLYGSDMKNLKINYPCLEEQTKIANFLSAIDEKIELVSVQIEETQEYKKGLLQQMFV